MDKSNIEEKDIKTLKDKNKKFKFPIKKTIIGIIMTGLVFSAIPNIQYQYALNQAQNSSYISEVLESDSDKKTQIAEIFVNAVKNNDNIPEETKDKIIKAFTEHVINNYGNFFTDETIYNMYAIASTEKITEMSDFAKKHGWWGGDYNSYTNKYSLESSIEDADEVLIAHEQLHAILKSGLFGTGLTTGAHGYALNEGLTSFLVKDDHSYNEETIVTNMLGLIIGYDNLINYYVNGDLSGLKKELYQYLPKKEAEELIIKLDLNVFSEYFETFLLKNNIPYNKDKINNAYHNRTLKIQEIMKKIFENKYGCKIDESNLGRIIFGSGSNYFDNNWDPSTTPLYIIEYYNNNKVTITLIKSGLQNAYKEMIVDIDDLENIDIDKIMDEFMKESTETELDK